MQTRSLLFAASLFALTACQEDLTAEKASWAASTKGWDARLEKMKKGHEDIAAKVKAYALPEEAAALAPDKAALDQALETGAAAIAKGEKELAAAKSAIEGLMAQGKKVPVEVALGTTGAAVDGVLLKAESLVSAANEALEQLTKKADAAKSEASALKARTEAWLGEVKKKGGALAVDDLVFNGGVLEVAKSKLALQALAAALKSCAELKADLSVTALGEAADLAQKRADALKAQLSADGVNAAVVAKVVANTVKEGEEKVSFAVTTPCK